MSEGDTKLGEITSFESLTYSQFTGLSIKYAEGEEKHLLIVLNLKMNNGEMTQIQIGNNKVKLEEERDIVELPVTSKEFRYECQEGDVTCMTDDDDDSACTITSISESNDIRGTLSAVLTLLFLAFAAWRRKVKV